jgi:ABC-type metal ion transport system substrate-binding protein
LDTNNLTAIDLTNNKKLVKINLTKNHLTEFSYCDSDCLSEAIIKNNYLKRVFIKNVTSAVRIEVCSQATPKQMESITVVDVKKLVYFSMDMFQGPLTDSSIVFTNVNADC